MASFQNFLGLTLDSTLNWHEHVNNVAKKIVGLIGSLYRASYLLHPDTKLALYYAHIHSHLTYMCHIWGAADSTFLRTLKILQNKAIRAIFKSEYQDPAVHTSDLFRRHRILTLDHLTNFSAAVMTYRIRTGCTHSSVRMETNSMYHSYETRRRSNIRPSQPHNR